MLMPKKVKYRKRHKGRMGGTAFRGGNLDFGSFGLQALECGRITDRQIEAARIAMTRYIKRGGKIWLRIFPDKPVSKKPAETRMGRVRAGRNIGLLLSGRGECFMRWREFLKRLQKKRFGWRSTSCLLRLGLSLEMIKYIFTMEGKL